MSILIYATSIILNLIVNFQVFNNQYSVITLILWLLSIFLLVIAFKPQQLISRFARVQISYKSFLLLALLFLPLAVRIINYNTERIHGDDLLTAYFSANYDLGKDNFFSAVPKNRTNWVAQFPTVYFALQKIFFLIFGENILIVKLSILPYILTISLALFLITKNLFGKTTAIISIFLYSFFFPSLYLETLGLHFTASAAVFILFFYFLIRSLKSNQSLLAVLTGLLAGASYWFYLSSYIALPILVITIFIKLISSQKIGTVKFSLLTLIAFLMAIGPFVTYAIKFNNYFFQRTNQISLLSGEWSDVKNKISKGEISIPLAIKQNLILTTSSLYKNGFGGNGGYDFGHIAFFDPIILLLFIFGFSRCCWLIITRHHSLPLLLVILTIFTSFATMVLSIPPPAFHRFSLAYPFIIIILVAPFEWFLSIKKINRKIITTLTVVILAVIIVDNQNRFMVATASEKENIDIRLSEYLDNHFPERKLYVAAFPGFVFEKIYYFAGNNYRKITTDYHSNLLQNFNLNEKYAYVILFPETFNSAFAQADPNGTIISFSAKYSLFVNIP